MYRILLTASILLFFTTSEAWSQDHQSFYANHLDINRAGMYFLGGWALANLATGTYGSLRYQGEQKYFHQMNAAWNLVNAAIATYALFDIAGADFSGFSNEEIIRRHIRSENIFLFNAGLDVLYMAGGAWMIHAARNSEKRHDLLKGYGQSVILQGGFLFLFDLAKYAIQYNHRQSFTDSVINLGASADGLSLTIRF